MKCSWPTGQAGRCLAAAPCGAVGVGRLPPLTPTPGGQCRKRTVGKSQLSHPGKKQRGGGASPLSFVLSEVLPCFCPAMGSTPPRLTLPAPSGCRRRWEGGVRAAPATVLAARERWTPLDSGARCGGTLGSWAGGAVGVATAGALPRPGPWFCGLGKLSLPKAG